MLSSHRSRVPRRGLAGAQGVLVASVLIAGGCSPYVYEKEIDVFAKAAGDFSDGLTGVQTHLLTAEDDMAVWHARAEPGTIVALSASACDQASTNTAGRTCHLKVGGVDYPFTGAGLVSEFGRWKAVSKYADALKAVADADDRSAFDAASASLAKSVEKLVEVTDAGSLVVPVVRAGLLLYRASLDQARLAQLRESVGAVNDRMPKIAESLTNALEQMKRHQIDVLGGSAESMSLTAASLRPSVERARVLEEMRASARRIRALQMIDPGMTLEKMVKAHDALAEALENPRFDLKELSKEIGEFADVAEAFKAALADPG